MCAAVGGEATEGRDGPAVTDERSRRGERKAEPATRLWPVEEIESCLSPVEAESNVELLRCCLGSGLRRSSRGPGTKEKGFALALAAACVFTDGDAADAENRPVGEA